MTEAPAELVRWGFFRAMESPARHFDDYRSFSTSQSASTPSSWASTRLVVSLE
jgi:hypothetical protein